jgi:uncharacterized protein
MPMNRLAAEASPYLQQHAANPVDWYPWGNEALERAQAEDKPLLISIGYAACHWCHVMAHESFEDPDTAAIQNALFINIKVDREERPDLDGIYMAAAQALTGRGGWPLNVFCLPDGTPFYAGTYFPPPQRAAALRMPDWPQVLRAVADAYHNRRSAVEQSAEQLLNHIRSLSRPPAAAAGPLDHGLLEAAVSLMAADYDPQHGGFGGAPKFPQPMALEALLRAARRNDPRAWPMLRHTLLRMAYGGIYDQVGGGFHRYSVDEHWLVPHFEKMLYDNALLLRLYREAAVFSGDAELQRIADETRQYLLRDLRHPDGAFFSSEDADSLPTAAADHAEEGLFYVWTPQQLQAVLGADAERVIDYYAVTAAGNFEGASILFRPAGRQAADAATHAAVQRSRPRLLAARAQRPRPFRDEKIITAWNAMAIQALCAGRPTDEDLAAAQACADMLLLQLRRSDGRLLRSWKDGRPRPLGFLDDYGLLISALLDLHAAAGRLSDLQAARELADAALQLFWDETAGCFFDTGTDQPALITRPRELSDNAVPSGSSAIVEALLQLAAVCAEARYARPAEQLINQSAALLARYPQGLGRMLAAADFALGPRAELAVIGDPADPATQALLAVARERYRPQLVTVRAAADADAGRLSPLLQDRPLLAGRPTAYFCRDYVCLAPVNEPAALRELLTAFDAEGN